ncbi:FAD-dependent oxidoreductase [Thiomonas sp. X19]|uniref:FAD-dependent oxidoreductase n=1 Tax=Thiomonas sp. X19 TaxID=1050370 RepID=UPI001E4275E3|nr:FAD-dependent oxidoreductase [Thiomonas sp. X19]
MNKDDLPPGPDLTQGVAASELTDGRPLLGHIGGQAVMLVRQGDAVHALAATCTHYGGPLAEGLVADGTVRCPWHHACFDLAGGAVRAPPALAPLDCWDVNRENGIVRVGAKRVPRAPPRPPRSPGSVVIAGGGAAGEAAASALREFGFDGSITLLAADSAAPVDRPNLSKDYLAGKAPEDWLWLRANDYWAQQRIDLRLHSRATELDLSRRRVGCANGESFAFDALLLATGAVPRRLDIPGARLPHVYLLRSLHHCQAIIEAVQAGAKKVAVIGASFIGLEVAAALRERGAQVQVIAPESAPLARVFGPRLAAAVAAKHRDMGTHLHLGCKPVAIHADTVELDDGTRVPADLVVMGVGVQPADELAREAALVVDRGIVVDARLRTSAPGVWAAGDVARFPDPFGVAGAVRIEHWAVAQAQGRLVARNMLGFDEAYQQVPFFWSQHGDMTVSYVGHAESWDTLDESGDPQRGDYLCRFIAGGRVLAVASVGRDLDGLREELAMEKQLAAAV